MDMKEKVEKLLTENSWEELMQKEDRLVVLNLSLSKLHWAGIELAAESAGETPSETIASMLYAQLLLLDTAAQMLRGKE